MAKIEADSDIELRVYISLSESEARALDALVGYGVSGFLEVFYEKMGKAYLKPHEEGLRSLFKSVREFMPRELSRADNARKVFGR